MHILAFAPELSVVEPEYTIVSHVAGTTNIARRWAEGVLDADPCCSRCRWRGPVMCLVSVRNADIDGREAELYSRCKEAYRPAARRGRGTAV